MTPPNPGRARAGSLAMAAVLVLLAACKPAPYAERRLQMRVDSMRTTAQTWAKTEESRPGKVERDVAYARQILDRDAAHMERDARWFVDWQKRDVERWRKRGPIYLDKAGKILWGEPERIEENAITLFF